MKTPILAALASLALIVPGARARNHLVLMTDFGLEDGAVAQMKGVVAGVDPQLRVTDLTHEIPPYDIWEASYRLNQAIRYWPGGTVFVSVVDPGVGTDRNSVVAELSDPITNRSWWVVTPNNGTLTLPVAELTLGRIYELDEARNRLPTGSPYHTFHGRDLYAYSGARLVTGQIAPADTGRALGETDLVLMEFPRPALHEGTATGIIPALDIHFGNVWSSIPSKMVESMGVGISDRVHVTITESSGPEARIVYDAKITFQKTFGSVPVGAPLAYINSLDAFALALNQGDFARAHGIDSGPTWRIAIRKHEGRDP